jgi:hypothetical protein
MGWFQHTVCHLLRHLGAQKRPRNAALRWCCVDPLGGDGDPDPGGGPLEMGSQLARGTLVGHLFRLA